MHQKNKHSKSECPQCGLQFSNRQSLEKHLKKCKAVGLKIGELSSDIFDIGISTQFNKAVVIVKLKPFEIMDVLDEALQEARKLLIPFMASMLEKQFKFDLSIFATFHKATDVNTKMQARFNPKGKNPKINQTARDVIEHYDKECDKIKHWVDAYNEKASN